MNKIRINGLVKFANRIRHDISRPVSKTRLAQIQKGVKDCLDSVSRILNETGLKLNSLPAPSLKAYQFLKNINFDAISTEDTAFTNDLSPNSVSFPRLTGYFNHTLDQLAQIDNDGDASRIQQIYKSICLSNENIEREIKSNNIKPRHLKSQPRVIRGWMAYFAQRENFDSYINAIRQAKAIFSEIAASAKKQPIQVRIHFLPIRGVYKIRGSRNLILAKLPTPMVCFDRETLRLLAEWIFLKSNNKKPVLDAMLGEPYQEIQSEIDILSGIEERTGGMHHDLAKSFDRVNSSYFNGVMNRPNLTWSQTFTFRKFGHYDHIHDTVAVSLSLDSSDIPEYVVDFIMYHELLHKKLKTRWNNGRNFCHTSEFTREEKLFQQYNESKTILNKLACRTVKN